MKTILVTGANGFVGRRLCRHLVESDYRVRASLRRPLASHGAIEDRIEYVVSGAIDETTDWTPHLSGIDAIVHCAARVHILRETAPHPLAAFRRVNVAGTERLARQAAVAGVKRFVLVSSIGAEHAQMRRPGAPPPIPYQISKWESENALFRVAEETGLEAVVLRPPLIYGPGAPGFFALLLKVVSHRLPLPFASIDNRRSIVYVGNLVDAARVCIEHPAAVGQTFAVSDGAPVSTPQLVRALGTALGRRAILLPFPPSLLRLAGRLAGQEFAATSLTGDYVVDDSAIRARLAWQARYSVAAALAETVQAEVARRPGPSAGR